MTPPSILAITDISWQTATLAGLCVCVFILVLNVVYRLTFHPLASYPGPFLAKCTSWYAAYQSYTGNCHLDVLRCHEKYGDVVRYRPNGLIVNNVEALHDIYVSPSRTQKSKGYFSFRGDGIVSILNAITRQEHSPHRKHLSRAFSVAALQQYEPTIIKTARVFCDTLLRRTDDSVEDAEGNPVHNVGLLSSCFTFDVVSAAAFDGAQDLIGQPQARYIVEGVDSAVFLNGMALQQPLLCTFMWLNKIISPSRVKSSSRFFEKSKELAKNRIMRGNEASINDMFGTLLGDGKTAQILSPIEMAADSIVLMAAGTDTSSVAISAFFFYLSRNPSTYQKLASEIRGTFVSAEEIVPGPTLKECKYLRACIDEAMRLAPPVGVPLWREMRATEQIAGHVLPKGTDVATCIYAVHRNPAYFPGPNVFRPERWLAEPGSEEQAALAKKAFVPFSVGYRDCIGKTFAYTELTTFLALVMYKADWELPAGALSKVGESTAIQGHMDYEIFGHYTSAKDGPYLRFVPRNLK